MGRDVADAVLLEGCNARVVARLMGSLGARPPSVILPV